MDENKKAWDDVFKDMGRVFKEPHSDVVQLSDDLQPAASKRVLDLGSGSGRHVVYLAQAGFDTYGFEIAEQGITMTQQWLADEGLEATLHQGDMTERLPYDDDFFDAVISIQVIHHARLVDVEAEIAEVTRVLKPNGTILITVPVTVSKRATHEEIEPHTFIPLDGIEKGLPHYIFDEARLRKSFAQFDIQKLYVDQFNKYSLWGRLKE